MTRDETLALWARCEHARARATLDEGADSDASHLAAKAVWNTWAKPLLTRRETMWSARTWKTRHDAFGSPEPANAETVSYYDDALADFSGHVFDMVADFRGFAFPGAARFLSAAPAAGQPEQPVHFKKDAWFDGAQFSAYAGFGGVNFVGDGGFDGAQFWGYAGFGGTQFSKGAGFYSAEFESVAWFRGAQFLGDAWFDRATFSGIAEFGETEFAANARFYSSEFSRGAHFNGAEFSANAWFDGADFSEDALFARSNFESNTSFANTSFHLAADFGAIRANWAFSLAGTSFQQLPNFVQAHFEEAPDLDATRFRRNSAEIGSFFGSMGWFWAPSVNPDVASRFRALKRMAIQAHDADKEHDFSAGELMGRRGSQDFAWPSVKRWLIRVQVTASTDYKGKTERSAPRQVWVFEPMLNGSTRAPRESIWPGGFRYWLGGGYGLFSDYGRSVVLPLLWWGVLTTIFWWLYLSVHIANHDALVVAAKAKVEHAKTIAAGQLPDSFPIEVLAVSEQQPYRLTSTQWFGRQIAQWTDGLSALNARPQSGVPAPPTLHCMGPDGYRHPEWDAMTLAIRKGFLFLGLDQAEVLTQINACLYGVDIASTAGRVGGELVPVLPYWVGFYSLVQTFASAVLIFLFLLAVRNMFKIK